MARRQLSPEYAERRAEVVRLRRQRLTWDEIGAQLNITGQRAGQLYAAAMLDIEAPDVSLHRREELALIDDATRSLMEIAQDPVSTVRQRIDAWNAVRGWAARKARLLGLDAPTALTHTFTIDMLDAEIARLTAELEGPGEMREIP